MKRFYTFLAAAGMSIGALMAQLPSRITVFSEDGNPFYLIVNGIKQNDRAMTNVLVDGLTMPNYKVKVIFEDPALPAIDKMIQTVDVDGNPSEVAYRIRRNKKNELVMNVFSFTPIAQAVQYNQSNVPPTMGVVNFRTSESVSNTMVVGSSVTTTTTTVGTPMGGGVNVDVIDPVTGERVNMNVGLGFGGASVTTTTTTTSQSSGNIGQPVPQQSQGCMYAMSSRDFESAKASIRGQSFEDNKLSTAKTIANSNCLTAEMVKDICGLFSFEESKLDFAKFAYARCTERSRYFIVNDVFSFSSSTEELNSYIASFR